MIIFHDNLFLRSFSSFAALVLTSFHLASCYFALTWNNAASFVHLMASKFSFFIPNVLYVYSLQEYSVLNVLNALFKSSIIIACVILKRCQPLRYILTSILNWKCLSCWIAEFFEKSAIQQHKLFQIKILVNIFRRGWHLCL